MPTYVSLTNWTEQGIKNYKDTLDRAQTAQDAIAAAGGSLRDIYYTIGPHDIVVIADFPDDESATAFLLKLGAQGNVRTTSMRAFSRDEMGRILEKAG
jgi:uncharacterized protein with GYD domain